MHFFRLSEKRKSLSTPTLARLKLNIGNDEDLNSSIDDSSGLLRVKTRNSLMRKSKSRPVSVGSLASSVGSIKSGCSTPVKKTANIPLMEKQLFLMRSNEILRDDSGAAEEKTRKTSMSRSDSVVKIRKKKRSIEGMFKRTSKWIGGNFKRKSGELSKSGKKVRGAASILMDEIQPIFVETQESPVEKVVQCMIHA